MLQGAEQHSADPLASLFYDINIWLRQTRLAGLAALIQLVSTQKDDPRDISLPLPLSLSAISGAQIKLLPIISTALAQTDRF